MWDNALLTVSIIIVVLSIIFVYLSDRKQSRMIERYENGNENSNTYSEEWRSNTGSRIAEIDSSRRAWRPNGDDDSGEGRMIGTNPMGLVMSDLHDLSQKKEVMDEINDLAIIFQNEVDVKKIQPGFDRLMQTVTSDPQILTAIQELSKLPSSHKVQQGLKKSLPILLTAAQDTKTFNLATETIDKLNNPSENDNTWRPPPSRNRLD